MSVLQADTERAKDIVKVLYVLQASVFTLMLKSWGVHWNISTLHFPAYHSLMSDLYTELIEVTDRVAESIGSLGYLSPASLKRYSEISLVRDDLDNQTGVETLGMILSDLFIVEGVLGSVCEEAIKVKNKAVENMCGEVAESLRVYIYKLRKTVNG